MFTTHGRDAVHCMDPSAVAETCKHMLCTLIESHLASLLIFLLPNSDTPI